MFQIFEVIFDTDKGKLWFKCGDEKKLASRNIIELMNKSGVLEDGFTFCACTYHVGNFIKILEFGKHF